jgi:hypothetical protein
VTVKVVVLGLPYKEMPKVGTSMCTHLPFFASFECLISQSYSRTEKHTSKGAVRGRRAVADAMSVRKRGKRRERG